MDRAASLLQQIYEDPASDEFRIAYADWLIDNGNPRGEFIQLQMLPKRTRAQRKRATSLLKKHRNEWLGPIAAAVKKNSVVFERGFLARAQLTKASCPPGLYGDPAWATVIELDMEFRSMVEGQFFTHPVFRSLRILRGLFLLPALKIIGNNRPLLLEEMSIERLAVYDREPLDSATVIRTLSAAMGIPKLRRLSVNAIGSVPQSEWLFESPLGRRLQFLSLKGLNSTERPDRSSPGQFLADGLVWLLTRTARPKTTVLINEWTLTLKGRELVVTCEVSQRNHLPSYATLITALNGLSGQSLDSLNFSIQRWMVPTSQEHQALVSTLSQIDVPGNIWIPNPKMYY